MRRPSKRQTGHGWGKAVVGLLKPLMSKVLAKSLMKRGAKALAEGSVSAAAEYGVKKLLRKKGRGRTRRRRLYK